MLSEVSNFVNTARADTFLLEASRGIIPASCRAPWSFDGERIEASKTALRAQWWAAALEAASAPEVRVSEVRLSRRSRQPSELVVEATSG